MLKMPHCAACGVAYGGLTDPTARTLEAYGRQDEECVLQASYVDEAKVIVELFGVAPFELSALWA